jgi:hypothetical protein
MIEAMWVIGDGLETHWAQRGTRVHMVFFSVVYLSFRKFSTERGELFLGKTIQFNSGGAAAERGATAGVGGG